MTSANVIERVCQALTRENRSDAPAIAREQYPFARAEKVSRRYTEYQMTSVFWRDGFTDRYSGERLVFPGTLRLLSLVLPEEFPAHPSWKMSASHIMFWHLFPTIDHVVPVTRGGKDDVSNWLTTSMLRNSAKAHWTLAELGWSLHPTGSPEAWDGLMRWFVEYTAAHPDVAQSPYIKRWRRAAVAVLGETSP